MRFLFVLLTWLLAAMPAQASVVYYLVAAPEPQIRALQDTPDRLGSFLYSGGPHRLYLDKAWHGLHWLLAGAAGTTAAPASRVILGGTEIGKDIGYGKARYFSPAEVKAIAQLLARLKEKDLRTNYSPAAMDKANIYPDDWVEWEKDGEDAFAMLLHAFQDLQAFYGQAAKARHAVVYAWG